MSFQGDVGGIGLAELLQSLARGRREGVLTLNSERGDVCTLGLEAGVMYLLPDPGEDASVWKERARQAWVRQPDFRIDAVRTSEIARAHRIERLFRLLDSQGVHFRFDQRPLPGRAEGPLELLPEEAEQARPQPIGAPRQPQVYCEGVSVEYLLLEYARLDDELSSYGGEFGFDDEDVPALAAGASVAESMQALAAECDSDSSVAEIADRLACPIRQGRLLVAEGLRSGALYLAQPEYLLALARSEINEGHVNRAASRLSAWVRRASPGPADAEAAEALEFEWREERLAPVLNRMRTPLVRTLVRRLDHAQQDPTLALHHWRELQRLRRHDGIVELHRIAAEFRAQQEEGEGPSLRELLEVSRGFRDMGRPRRAAAILRMAAERMPTSNAARLDIGIGLVAAGMVDEGAPWILDTAKALVAAGAPDKALGPLRTLIEAAPEMREARRQLIRARNLAMRRQLIRKHSAVGMAVLVALALGAWVQIRIERTKEKRFQEVANRLTDPLEARELFDRYFSNDDSPEIVALDQTIRDKRKELETRLRTDWYESFRQAQLECSFGDVLVGLERSLAIPNPPVLVTVKEPWPLVSDLFNGLAARLEGELHDLGEPQLDAPQQVRAEDELAARAGKLVEKIQPLRDDGRLAAFRARLEALLADLGKRAKKRDEDAAERDRLDTSTRQEMLYESARSHAKAGDIERALSVYDRLLAGDPTGKLAEILHDEIEGLRTRYDAMRNARKLALEGRHPEAIALLKKHLDKPESVALPWKLESFPAGAVVKLPDGEAHLTPYQFESHLGEELRMRLELAGHLPTDLTVTDPADRFIWLSRAAERSWVTAGLVQALPVAVGGDHIVCDRAGRIARLGANPVPRWERQLGSLGGVARSPVFLSQRNGYLLAVTEDGEAWIVEARTGELEGPWDLGSPPVSGPTPTAEGVVVTLRDGRVATWTQRLKPSITRPDAPASEADAPDPDSVANVRTFTSGMQVLRAPAGGERKLDSPWTPWTVEVRDAVFLVQRRDDAGQGFAVKRQGEWNYVAWEAPHGLLPTGRLWVADGAGLRSYLP